jgi:hypothetical protein
MIYETFLLSHGELLKVGKMQALFALGKPILPIK